MRANEVPTREALTRVRGGLIRKCRRCSERSETLHHVMGACKTLSRSTSVRHNKLCKDLAAMAAKQNWTVLSEPVLQLPSRKLSPDLMFKKGGTTVVVDVTALH